MNKKTEQAECAHGEREAFEAWWQSIDVLRPMRDVVFDAWQARAALAKPSPVAQAGQLPKRGHAEFLDWAEKVLNDEQTRLSAEDYLMDSDDCIHALREAAAPQLANK